jgi:hypothetical protein
MAGIKSQSEARADAEAADALKKRAARQAAVAIKNPVAPTVVECVVLPMGDGKISMGEHVASLGEAHYEEGEKLTVALDIALNLYERGYVNFEGAKAAMAERRAQREAEAIAAAKERTAQVAMLNQA